MLLPKAENNLHPFSICQLWILRVHQCLRSDIWEHQGLTCSCNSSSLQVCSLENRKQVIFSLPTLPQSWPWSPLPLSIHLLQPNVSSPTIPASFLSDALSDPVISKHLQTKSQWVWDPITGASSPPVTHTFGLPDAKLQPQRPQTLPKPPNHLLQHFTSPIIGVSSFHDTIRTHYHLP